MAAKKARKREYIPPSNEIINRRERTAPSKSARVQRSTAQARGGRGAQPHQYPQPSLKRTLKRLPLYFLLIFALQYWFAGQDERNLAGQERLLFAAGSAAFVTILFAPFMHVMDKFAYNRFLKRTGQQPQPPAETKS